MAIRSFLKNHALRLTEFFLRHVNWVGYIVILSGFLLLSGVWDRVRLEWLLCCSKPMAFRASSNTPDIPPLERQ
jgi:hypothetical protein